MVTKRTLIITASVAALVIGLGAAGAIARAGHGWGQHGFGGEFGHGGRHGAGMMGMMTGDLCRDGRPDRAEMQAAFAADGLKWEAVAAKRDACFAKFDTDKSGTIDAAEITAAVDLRAKGLANKAVAMFDDDVDGKIARDEVSGGWFGRRHDRKPDRAADVTAAPQDKSAAPKPGDAATATTPEATDGMNDEDSMDSGPGNRGGGRGAMLTKMFDQADTNKDGTIDATELTAMSTLLVEDGKRRILHRLDKDKSGSLSRAEFDQPARDRFAMGDLNDNGIIARDELPLPMQWRLAN